MYIGIIFLKIHIPYVFTAEIQSMAAWCAIYLNMYIVLYVYYSNKHTNFKVLAQKKRNCQVESNSYVNI